MQIGARSVDPAGAEAAGDLNQLARPDHAFAPFHWKDQDTKLCIPDAGAIPKVMKKFGPSFEEPARPIRAEVQDFRCV